MSDFTFDCPHCKQSLEAPRDMLGKMVECPSCNGLSELPEPEINAPSTPPKRTCPSCRQAVAARVNICGNCMYDFRSRRKIPGQESRRAPKKEAASEKRATAPASFASKKLCPYCGESILDVAIICKHCRSNLNDRPGPTIQRTEIIGAIALMLPICSVMIAWFWLSSMPLIHAPSAKLGMILVITIIASSVLVAVEANTVGAGSNTDLDSKGKKRGGPVTWFLRCVLLWIVAFPAWMAYRAKYGLKDLCFASVLSALVFVGVSGFMSYAIEQAKSDARKELKALQEELEQFQREMEDAQRELENIWSH